MDKTTAVLERWEYPSPDFSATLVVTPNIPKCF